MSESIGFQKPHFRMISLDKVCSVKANVVFFFRLYNPVYCTLVKEMRLLKQQRLPFQPSSRNTSISSETDSEKEKRKGFFFATRAVRHFICFVSRGVGSGNGCYVPQISAMFRVPHRTRNRYTLGELVFFFIYARLYTARRCTV